MNEKEQQNEAERDQKDNERIIEVNVERTKSEVNEKETSKIKRKETVNDKMSKKDKVSSMGLSLGQRPISV